MQKMKDFFEFKKLITPAVIKVIFMLGVVLSFFMGTLDIKAGVNAIDFGGSALIFAGILKIFFGPIVVRVWCEIIVVLFKINDSLTEIKREQKKDE
jgi:hypothetical protein